MKTVLHLTTSGAQLWVKGAQGWQPQEGPARGHVWVLTDLAEEAFAELAIPRIFGRDRQAFVARQLAARFPDTLYRTVLQAGSGGGFMDRLAPPRQPMLGIDAAARIDAAVDSVGVPVAGVWATSMLLAQIGSAKSLPSELFVVLPGQDVLRIVVLKDRVPVLSRLVAGIIRPGERATEVVRTLRHLENTRVLERGERHHGVLVLGDSTGMADLLAADKMDLLPWSAHASGQAPTWPDALFDRVVKSPAGQLAPLAKRTRFVASELRRAAYGAACVSMVAAVWASADNLRTMWAAQSQAAQLHAQVQQLLAQGSGIDSQMLGFGVTAEVVRRAVALDVQEVASAPSLETHLRELGLAVGRFPGVYLSQLEWRVLPPGRAACPSAAANPGAPAPLVNTAETPSDAQAQPDARLVELGLDISLPENLREKAHLDTVTALSLAMRKIDGANLLRDPAQELAQTAMTGGGSSSDAGKSRSWCLSLPGSRKLDAASAAVLVIGTQQP